MHTISVAVLLAACLLVSEMAFRWTWQRAATTCVAVAALFLLLRAGSLGTEAWVELATFLVVSAALLHVRHGERLERDYLARLCDVDEVTSCLNRRGFAAVLERESDAALRAQSDIALVALDLDHFKQVNDRFGHLVGDEVLLDVGRMLAEEVGARGGAARMGGEEFAVLLPGADAENAGVVAERILATIRARQFPSLPSDIRLTLSAGIAAERAVTPGVGAALRARSDEALYAAKRSGRDRAFLWAPGVHSNATPVRPAPVVEGQKTFPRRPSGPWRAPA